MSEIQKDLVLSPNQFAYVLDETKGNISCLVGPTKMSLSQSDKLVKFNEKSKSFEPCGFEEAKYLFTVIPENWYCILKNPAKDNRHPTRGASNTFPEEMRVGQKINIQGPDSFALYPGQMSRVIRGHSLRSNQYLLARVYEANAANISTGDVRDAEGKAIEMNLNYVNGQILVIKGTEISFYIPPTGIEVVAVNNDPSKGYIREAVTLERLEYCILKDEDGNKRYVHGPAVVFPEPTESFVTSPKGGHVFRASELSKISGIYIKVIADYKDENGIEHKAGEEMFITGNEQMIYYPRPEHAIITYDGKTIHHAIAIPEGEGRYIMNRMTGEINTVRGPAMYLPDPRTEIVVKRKLTSKQCALWYPGNKEILAHNEQLTEKSLEKSLKKNDTTVDAVYAFSNDTTNFSDAIAGAVTSLANLASFETNASISRGTSYTKPRTITLDNKYDGVVTINVWSGYAVNVVSPNGTRNVVLGPQTILLDYEQTLETFKKGNQSDVYLKIEHNKFYDEFKVETADNIECTIGLTYNASYLMEYMDKWFNIEDSYQYAIDQLRTVIRREAANHSVKDFYQNYSDIIYNSIISETIQPNGENIKGYMIKENGLLICDCDINFCRVPDEIEQMFIDYHADMLARAMKLEEEEDKARIAELALEAERKEHEVEKLKMLDKLALQREEAIKKLEIQTEVNRKQDAEKKATKQAENDLQVLYDAIHESSLERERKAQEQKIKHEKELADIERVRQEAYANTIREIMTSIQPELIAAMESKSNADMTVAIAESMAPYAIARGESAADVVNKLLRGTSLENVIKGIDLNVNN